MKNYSKVFSKQFDLFFEEDEIYKNFVYLNELPDEKVKCFLKIKDDMILAGLPFFCETFNYLSNEKFSFEDVLSYEGRRFSKDENAIIEFSLPFNIALTAERIALNLLQRASSVATYTNKFVETAGDVRILDTRKTTPGLRILEKYAVKMGGGVNHRFSQTDTWMIKDNHKKIFGGVLEAIEYFQNVGAFYQNLVVEIHDLEELEKVAKTKASHFMLDNFSVDELKQAIEIKKDHWSYEVSGGITLEKLENYCLEGVDAISTGSIVYNAPQVDLSLKMDKYL